MYFALTEKPRVIQQAVRSLSKRGTVLVAGNVIKAKSFIAVIAQDGRLGLSWAFMYLDI